MRLPLRAWKRTWQSLGFVQKSKRRPQSKQNHFETLEPKQMLAAYYISGSASAMEGSAYTLSLSTTSTTMNHWTIDWGDGTTASPDVVTYSGNPTSESHTYASGAGNYQITATATDATGDHLAYEAADPSFGTAGTVITGNFGTDYFGGALGGAATSIVQNNGQLTVAGATSGGDYFTYFLAARYNDDGSLDTSFGTGGTNSFNLGGYADDPVSLSRVGNSVLATGGGTDIGVEFFSVGTAGPSGGADGGEGTNVGVQSDGKILIAVSGSDDEGTAMQVMRFNTDSSIDNSFGDDGSVFSDVPDESYEAFRPVVAVQSNGDIVVATQEDNGFEVARFDSSGNSLDPDGLPQAYAFGDSGVATVNAIQVNANDDSISVIGSFNNQVALLHLNEDGTPDSSLNGTGMVLSDFHSGYYPMGMAFDADNNFVVAGQLSSGSGPQLALAYYNADGTPDSSFGNGGIVLDNLGSNIAVGTFDGQMGIVVQSDGKIDVAAGGYNWSTSTGGFLVTRVLGTQYVSINVTQPALFYNDGDLVLTGSDADETISVGTTTVGGVSHLQVSGVTGDDISGVLASDVTSIIVQLGSGTDTLNLSGVTAAHFTSLNTVTVYAGTGSDTISGGSGNETFVFDPSSVNSADTLTADPTAASNTLDFSSFTDDLTIDISSTSTQYVDVTNSSVLNLTLASLNNNGDTGIDNVIGGSGVNTITGNARNNILDGSLGTTDYLYGGDGNDVLYGGAGDDTLEGDAGNDALYGGDGSDTLHGNAGNDYLYGQNGDDHLYGDAGNDRLEGGAGDDDLHGGTGDDTYVYRWNPGDYGLGSDTIDDNTGENNKVDFSEFFATDFYTPDLDTAGTYTISDDQASDPLVDGSDQVIRDLLTITYDTASTLNTETDPTTFITSVAGVTTGQISSTQLGVFAYGVAGTLADPATSVNFYYDTNRDGLIDSGDLLIGTDSDGSDGWSTDLSYDASQGAFTYDDGGTPTAIPSSDIGGQIMAEAVSDGGTGSQSDPTTLPSIIPPNRIHSVFSRYQNDYGLSSDVNSGSEASNSPNDYHEDGDVQHGIVTRAVFSHNTVGPNPNGQSGSTSGHAVSSAGASSGETRNLFIYGIGNSTANANASGAGAITTTNSGIDTGISVAAGSQDDWSIIPKDTDSHLFNPLGRYSAEIKGTVTFYWFAQSSGDANDSADVDSHIEIKIGTSDGPKDKFTTNSLDVAFSVNTQHVYTIKYINGAPVNNDPNGTIEVDGLADSITVPFDFFVNNFTAWSPPTFYINGMGLTQSVSATGNGNPGATPSESGSVTSGFFVNANIYTKYTI